MHTPGVGGGFVYMCIPPPILSVPNRCYSCLHTEKHNFHRDFTDLEWFRQQQSIKANIQI